MRYSIIHLIGVFISFTLAGISCRLQWINLRRGWFTWAIIFFVCFITSIGVFITFAERFYDARYEETHR